MRARLITLSKTTHVRLLLAASRENRQRHICVRLVIMMQLTVCVKATHHYVHFKEIRISLIHILHETQKKEAKALLNAEDLHINRF